MKALFSKYSTSYDPGSSQHTTRSPLEHQKVAGDTTARDTDGSKNVRSKSNSGQLRNFMGRGGNSSLDKIDASGVSRENDISPFNTAIAMSRERGGRNLMDSIRRKSPTRSADRMISVKGRMGTGANEETHQEAPLVVFSANHNRQGPSNDVRSQVEKSRDDSEGTSYDIERSLGDPASLKIPERRQSRRSSSRTANSTSPRAQVSPKDDDATPKQTMSATFTSVNDKPQPDLPASPFLSDGSGSAPATPQLHPTAEVQQHQDGENRAFSRIWKLKNGSKTNPELQSNLNNGSPDGLATLSDQTVSPTLVFAPKPKPALPTRSYNLASELNDLAVAHEEGLLGEEEYRLLRQAAFLKTEASGGMELPKEERFQSARQSTKHQSPESAAIASSPPPSMASRRSSKSNIMSLFRRGSKTGQDAASIDGSIGGSVLDGAAPSMKSNTSKAATLETRLSQARRARSIRSDASHNLSIEPTSQSKENWTGTYSQLGRGSSLLSGSGNSASGLSMSSGSALLADQYRDKTIQEIESEIALVDSEGKRIIEGFKSLQMSTMGRYSLSYDLLQKALRDLDDVNGSEYEEFVLVDSNGKDNNSEQNGNIDRFGSFMRRNKSTGNVMPNSRLERSSPPSSYKGISSRGTNPAGPPLALLSQNHAYTSDARRRDEDSNEGMTEVMKLRAELADILRRRDDVAKRYADRLAFLRSTLRSAKIRQTLR